MDCRRPSSRTLLGDTMTRNQSSVAVAAFGASVIVAVAALKRRRRDDAAGDEEADGKGDGAVARRVELSLRVSAASDVSRPLSF